mmetsp:Transcript_30668/g.62113  ORF Transcript_30668/g.62113 Transcript_30668/m.62113 type:complete len:242 (-) Transcript_30668:79-804(-)
MTIRLVRTVLNSIARYDTGGFAGVAASSGSLFCCCCSFSAAGVAAVVSCSAPTPELSDNPSAEGVEGGTCCDGVDDGGKPGADGRNTDETSEVSVAAIVSPFCGPLIPGGAGRNIPDEDGCIDCGGGLANAGPNAFTLPVSCCCCCELVPFANAVTGTVELSPARERPDNTSGSPPSPGGGNMEPVGNAATTLLAELVVAFPALPPPLAISCLLVFCTSAEPPGDALIFVFSLLSVSSAAF